MYGLSHKAIVDRAKLYLRSLSGIALFTKDLMIDPEGPPDPQGSMIKIFSKKSYRRSRSYGDISLDL